MLTDCHTHLDQYPPGELSGVLHRARDAGVGFIIAAGTTLASSEACVRLSTQEPLLWSGVGIHPMDVTAPLGDATCERLHTLATSSPRVVTISEVGLDFSEHAPDLALQYQAFRQQIRLARELGLPIIFHSRELPEHPEGHSEVLRVLREERGWEVGGAMHYFQGDERTARECLDLGFLISLARPLMRLPQLQDLARKLPLEAFVLETDSFPQPFKGKRENWTEPRHVREVAGKLAQLKGTSLDEVAQVTTANLSGVLTRKASPGRATLLGRALGLLQEQRPDS